MEIINIANLDIIFGRKIHEALLLLDQNKNREEIKKNTRCILGVKNINLSINKGEIFVLMGLSGSGKSTLLRAINGLNKITRGEIKLNFDKNNYSLSDISKKNIRSLRMKYVSMVFQNFALLPWRTVLDNVGLGLEIAKVESQNRKSKSLKALKLVGLDTWANQYPKELSGGMKQRVGLARALATDAEILLMDEPFSALDPLIRANLQNELLGLQKSLQKTIVFVTHDLEEAVKLGSRVAIMQDGMVIQIGAPEEILNKPKNQYVKEFVAHVPKNKIMSTL